MASAAPYEPPAPPPPSTPPPFAFPSAILGAPAHVVATRPVTAAERTLLLQSFRRLQGGALAGGVVALILAILFYSQPGFIVMILAVALVAAMPGVAAQTARARKAIAGGVVTDLHGIPGKLGARGAGTYGLQFGTEVIAVPLAVYDRFGPNVPGTLTLLDGANLVLAVNGQPLPKPMRARRPTRGAFRRAL